MLLIMHFLMQYKVKQYSRVPDNCWLTIEHLQMMNISGGLILKHKKYPYQYI